jgi:peptidase E
MSSSIQVVALGGGGFSTEPDNPLLDNYILKQSRRSPPRVCFVPTASGDNALYIEHFYRHFDGRCIPVHLSLFARTVADLTAFLVEQDIVYVGGGNTANLLAVWRAHRCDDALRVAAQNGVVLAGVSAGALCWFMSGLTDSFGPPLTVLERGLRLISMSGCPHYDADPARRRRFHELIANGRLAPGVAIDNGAGVHFVDGDVARVVASHPGATAYAVDCADGQVRERALPSHYLGT